MAKKGLRRKASWIVRWRLLVQTAFLGVWLLPLRMFTVCSPVFHCYACPLATFACPIGVLAQFSALHAIPFIALGTLVVVGGLFGGFIGGWVCPFGWLQDLAAKVPTRKITLPRWTAHGRYVVLIGLVLLVPFFFGEESSLFICRVCPAGAIEGAVPSVVGQAVGGQPIAWPSVTKIVILVVFVVAIFFIYRPWCTVLCPLGLIFGLFNRISMFFMRFNPKLCLDCTLCRKMCKVGVAPDKRANDPRCTRCLDCTRCWALVFTNAFKSAERLPEAEGAEAAAAKEPERPD
jgi:ferredoxin-type protein NapH